MASKTFRTPDSLKRLKALYGLLWTIERHIQLRVKIQTNEHGQNPKRRREPLNSGRNLFHGGNASLTARSECRPCWFAVLIKPGIGGDFRRVGVTFSHWPWLRISIDPRKL